MNKNIDYKDVRKLDIHW